MRTNRRDLIKNAGLASGAALFGVACGSSKVLPGQEPLPSSAALPNPADSGIEHIVVVTMENRSFDHFLGWLPNADARQAGLTFVDKQGVSHATHSLSGDNTGCPHPVPDHSYGGGRVEYDDGAMDGALDCRALPPKSARRTPQQRRFLVHHDPLAATWSASGQPRISCDPRLVMNERLVDLAGVA